MDTTVVIRRAGPTDAGRCVRVLAAAFHQDPVSGWLFPDPQERERRQFRFFTAIVEQVLADGEVFLTADGDGVALWLDVPPDREHPPMSADERIRAAVGAHQERLSLLDEQMRAAHPCRHPHSYLPFIGVLPHRQRHGLGQALLAHKLADLDRVGAAAYLQASCARSQSLYRRAGFRGLPHCIALPDGPRTYPMWRDATAGGGAGSALGGNTRGRGHRCF